MPKNDKRKENDASLVKEDADVVERVKNMMDLRDTKVSGTLRESDVRPLTAPEITGKVREKQDSDSEMQQPGEEVSSEEKLSAPLLDEKDTSKSSESSENVTAMGEDVNIETENDNSLAQDLDNTEPPEDTKTVEAVEDIVRKESDDLIKSEDEELEAAFKPHERKSSLEKIKEALRDIWRNPVKRKIFILSLSVIVIIVSIVPVSRYFLLNTVGVRASTSIRVVDESTLQPLKNATVSVKGSSVKTDENGNAKLERIKLGPATLKIERRAFASVDRKITIGWGSNPFGEEKLHPTGTQYAFLVTDYLSGKPVVKAEATSDDASAFSDENGKILLTLDSPADEIEVRISSIDRRIEILHISGDSKGEHKVEMVPSRKHTFISRRAGRYDVFAVYADGKDETLLLQGTGSERADMALIPHPKDNLVALVSTREGKRNQDGYLLSTLDIINTANKEHKTVQTAEKIQVIGWFDQRLAYVRVVSGASASNPKRNRLMAYHYEDETNNELAASNYFNDVMAVDDRIYYIPNEMKDGETASKLFSIKADGNDRKVVLDKDVWNIFRTSFDHIALSVPGEWYDYQIGSEKPKKIGGEPANMSLRVYENSPDNKKSVWVDNRDGKGTLIAYDIAKKEEKILQSKTGIRLPVSWIGNNTVTYRVKTETESADYAVSLDGGEPKKITDVTHIDGLNLWYYY